MQKVGTLVTGIHVAVNGIHVAVNGIHVAVNGIHVAVNGIHVAVNGIHVAVNGIHVAVNGIHVAVNGIHVAVNGIHVAVNGICVAGFRKLFRCNDVNRAFCICARCCTASPNLRPPRLFRPPFIFVDCANWDKSVKLGTETHYLLYVKNFKGDTPRKSRDC